jgi:hypothetical protein
MVDPLSFPNPGGDLGVASVVVILSYILGHLAQRLGEMVELTMVRFWKGGKRDKAKAESSALYTYRGAGAYFTKQLLSDDAERSELSYPMEIRQLIRNRARETFGLTEKVTPKQLFDLSQAIPSGLTNSRGEIFLAISGFSRGMLTVSLAALAISAYMWFVGKSAPEATVVFWFSLASIFIWIRAFRRFSWYFVDAVWTDFLAWSFRDSKVGLQPRRRSILGRLFSG